LTPPGGRVTVQRVDRGRRYVGAFVGLVLLGAGTAAALAAPSLTLKQRLMVGADFPAYERSRVVMVPTAAGWAHANPWITPQTLRQEGFVTAGYADLKAVAPGRRTQTSVLSIAVRFRSRYGAAVYALTFLRIQPSQVKRFTVQGVPHAYGLASRRAGGSFYEIGWVDGPFVYLLTAFSVEPALPPTRAQTEQAAARWYARVHGHPAA
jgi:hypothetical protein